MRRFEWWMADALQSKALDRVCWVVLVVGGLFLAWQAVWSLAR